MTKEPSKEACAGSGPSHPSESLEVVPLPQRPRPIRHTLVSLVSEIHDDVSDYFRSLGFKVTWDFSRRTGLHWYELSDGDELNVQIDFGATLDDLKIDLPRLARGEHGIGVSNWEVRGGHTIDETRDLVRLVVERMNLAGGAE